MKKIIVLILTFAFALCGCSRDSAVPEETVVETITETQTVPTTQPPTEPTTVPTTEPDVSISVSAGDHKDTYTDDETGDYMDYYLFVPENAVKDMPLIIYLHGDGRCTNNVDALVDNMVITRSREIYGQEFPYIVLAPSTRVQSWIKGTIPGTLMGLIENVVERCEINPDKVIITGYSRGSIGLWHMISTYGSYFSAAVPVSCGSENPLNIENCCQVPIRGFAGNGNFNESKYYWAMNHNVELINEAGGNAELIQLSGKIHSQTQDLAYTEETFEWMLAQ